ncbi:MAG: hypothetical protein CME32_07330 [Gimesia sp.]|nr:hypothetical protein [Gimesia sp.]
MHSIRNLFRNIFILVSTGLTIILTLHSLIADEKLESIPDIKPEFECKASMGKDQDDMCIWVHPDDPALSIIITADKAVSRLFVYDLTGKELHSLKVSMPGNIDLRNGFKLGNKSISLVVCNQREGELKLLAFCVDPISRKLIRIDNGNILTKENYGGALYQSQLTGKHYFFSTTMDSGVEQFELFDDGNGKVGGKLIRHLPMAKSEGAVADDKAGVVYVAEEEGGIWKINAEPGEKLISDKIVKIGDYGLKGDIEGLAIYSPKKGKSYLIVSDQGRSQFLVFDRTSYYSYVGSFSIEGAKYTDGIEVSAVSFPPLFPAGIFTCHTDAGERNTFVVSWAKIAKALNIP